MLAIIGEETIACTILILFESSVIRAIDKEYPRLFPPRFLP